MVAAGTCFVGAFTHVRARHLWIVLTNPGSSGSVVAVHVTTSPAFWDDSLVLAPGDHPWIRQPSSVVFAAAHLAVAAAIDEKIADGSFTAQDPASPDLVRRIRQAAIGAPMTPAEVAEVLRRSVDT